ncbi:MAG: cytochrome C peroxidase [Saprospiraceae bacterium]|nr:cytochrome C peroxidase [Saprospiraceae bacterium]
MKLRALILLGMIAILGWTACEKDNGGGDGGCDNCPVDELIEGEYDPETYTIATPSWVIQNPQIPADNPMTEEGVALGRMLFYDPILSSDGSMSCSSCHKLNNAMTDINQFSVGVQGIEGFRNSMPLFNLAFTDAPFFWDGRSVTLEEQALIPVEDHTELNESWPNVIRKLAEHPDYPKLFREAFGIERTSEITKELAVKAIAQFERSIVSFNSRYDRIVQLNDGWFTEAEKRGRDLFFIEPNSQDDTHPGCSHCHSGSNLTNNLFMNNGLDDVDELDQFADKGRGAVTGNVFDNGKFKVPSLRNIALTAPYMHDGRFQTLEEVLDHYSAGGHGVINEDVNIRPFPLDEQQKSDLITFLEMLTDTSFVNNPAYASPFE